MHGDSDEGHGMESNKLYIRSVVQRSMVRIWTRGVDLHRNRRALTAYYQRLACIWRVQKGASPGHLLAKIPITELVHMW